jgi:hypothetical protein
MEAGKRGPFIPHAEVERTLAQRAHAAGIAEGLRRAEHIAEGVLADGYTGDGQHDAAVSRLKHALDMAMQDVAPADREPAPLSGGGAG